MGTAGLVALRTTGLAIAASLLVGCGGGGGPNLPIETLSPPTEIPSLTATLPEPTRTPTRPELPTQTEEPTDTEEPVSPTRTETPTEPPTQTVTTTERPVRTVTTSAIAAPTPSATPSPSATGSAADSGTQWLWWLLAAVAVAAAVAIPLLVRAQRRGAWREDLAAAEGEVAWFARALIPELRQSSSLDQVAGGWAVASSRVSALEDRLTALEATAPDDADRLRARALRDAVRTARRRVSVLITAGQVDTLGPDLDEVAADVDRTLVASQPAW
jgi:hypothetical protein